MEIISTSKIQEINRLNSLAIENAINALEYAKEAGMLLLEVKSELKHGEFLNWINDNLNVSPRQAQRYMDVAKGKPIPIRSLTSKYDTVSHLDKPSPSLGEWKDGHWQPESGGSYIFKDETGAYFVDSDIALQRFHVCKHYDGERLSTNDAYWRYTIYAEITDPDFTSQYYIGTRHPITHRSGIEGVLKSYGLKDIKGSLILGYVSKVGLNRPHGEPDPESWYWDSDLPQDDLFELLANQGHMNSRGAITPNVYKKASDGE